MNAEGWVTIIVALGGFVTILGTAIVGVIIAWRTGQKIDQAAQRREEIAQSPPGSPSPPPTLAPPKE